MRELFGAVYNFPGPKPAEPFKAFIRRHDYEASTSTPPMGATATDVSRALKVAEEFELLQRDTEHCTPQEFAARWRGFLTAVEDAAVRRDPNVMIDGSVYALTAITAVRPGREPLLRERLRALRCPDSPFARLPSTHFARFVVLDRLAFEGPAGRPAGDRAAVPALLLDLRRRGQRGARRLPRAHVPARARDRVDEIFGLCAGAPGRRRARAVPRLDRLPPGPDAARSSLTTEREGRRRARARALRGRADFALRVPYARPDVPPAQFEQTFRR